MARLWDAPRDWAREHPTGAAFAFALAVVAGALLVLPLGPLGARLVWLGALLEAVGFGLAFREIRSVERSVETDDHRPQFIEPGSIALGLGVAHDARVIVDPPPPLEERVAALEARVANVANEAERRLGEVRGQLREEWEGDLARTHRAMKRGDDELRRHIRALAAPDLRQRQVALLLFVAGLAVGTIGNTLPR